MHVTGTVLMALQFRRTARAIVISAAVLAFAAFRAPAGAAAGGYETVTTCGAGIFNPYAMSGMSNLMFCPPGTNIPPGMSIMTGDFKVPAGTRASWRADAPPGLMIVAVVIPHNQMYSLHLNDGSGWGGGFYWQGGSAQSYNSTFGFGTFFYSHYFGFQLICGWSVCDPPDHSAQITVQSINLDAQETQGPWIGSPDGLWQAQGWVRGAWPLHFYGDSPSGLCSLSATLNGQPVAGATSVSAQVTNAWHQCAAPGVAPTVSTWTYGQGPIPLTLDTTDAAGLSVSYDKTVYVDNSTPAVSLSGATDVAYTGSPAYVTATGGGSPSGIAGVSCSVDGAPAQWYAGASAQVPVSGIGEHSVQCASENNATDAAGNHGWSGWQSWALKIGVPTVSGIAFQRIVDSMRCQLVREPVRVPARWITIRRHHRVKRVRKRAHTKIVKVMHCRPRTAWRRVTVWVTVRRHGRLMRVKRTRRLRIVLPPHAVMSTRRWVRFGAGTSVSGWLGTSTGTALGGQTVRILTAPDNGLGQFAQAAVAVTEENGSWTAQLPAGPSRLVEAVYDGSPTTQPSVSGQVRLIVPAKVRLVAIEPRRLAWGGTIHIAGQLLGGYLPPGGALVRLRIGFGSSYTTYGVQEHVTGSGRFTTTYTFGLGDPDVRRSYWFQIASLPMGDYPYAPAASRRITVTVGGNARSSRRSRSR